jgi:hypothetical protein
MNSLGVFFIPSLKTGAVLLKENIRLFTLNDMITTKISVFLLKQKIFQDYLETYQISTLTNNILTNPSLINGFYITATIILFCYSMIERENKEKINKLQKLGFSKEMEKRIEIFLFIFMMIMTKNVEYAS